MLYRVAAAGKLDFYGSSEKDPTSPTSISSWEPIPSAGIAVQLYQIRVHYQQLQFANAHANTGKHQSRRPFAKLLDRVPLLNIPRLLAILRHKNQQL